VNIDAAGNRGVVVRGATSQTANLQEWQSSGSTPLVSVGSSGTLSINQSNTGSRSLAITLPASQAADPIRMTDSNSVALFSVASTGRISNTLNSPSATGMTITAATSQSANLQEWRNVSGTPLTLVDSAGRLIVGGGAPTTTATATSGAGQTSLVVANAAGIVVGSSVSGTGIVSTTKVSVVSGTTITIDTATNASWVSGGTVTFGPALNSRTVASFAQTGSNGTAIEINAPTGTSNTANIFFGPDGGTAVGQISVDPATANGMALGYYGTTLRLARAASGGTTFYTAVSMPYTAVTTATTLDGTHYTLDCTSGTFTVTLPAASTTLGQAGFTGRIYNIKNSGTGIITIGRTGTNTIDGATSITMNGTTKQYQTITVQSTGTGWIIL
jgi:hypothetical protein